jgi:hypothetical protein
MKYWVRIAATCAALAVAPLALAQAPSAGAAGFLPRLGDIMSLIQLRHIKLSFAGKLRNWDLAAYEIGQIKSGFEDAAVFYPGIPVTDMSFVAGPIRQLADAVESKNGPKFDKAFVALTGACNACHQSIGRGFVVIQVPAASPFSDQSFIPAAK